ncbi:polyamine-modulated factor 1-like [Acanthaster planci]|uniref:Polyamine-modulated factor 1-like n=1 Tax=Acanthaster planci TaxID=133434 RepID=A0A8B7Z7P3_ACAPL|nr:polyamine-modulated factor 1-like [Acanthaster planci]
MMATESNVTSATETLKNEPQAGDSTLTLSKVEEGVTDEGSHMIRLREALQKTLKKCLEAGRYSVFARSYSFAHEKSPEALRSIREQFLENLESYVQKELELMIEEEGLVKLFNELDQYIQDAPTQLTQPAWRPSGNPVEDSRSHLVQPKLKEKERLEHLLEQIEQENKRLHQALLPRKQYLLSTKQKITEKLKTFDRAVAACRKIPADEMEEMSATLSGAI